MAVQRTKNMMATLRPVSPVLGMVTKKASAAKTAVTSAASDAAGKVSGGTVTQMPQSQAAGAISQGIYLYTNDVWAQRYFDPNDLHSVERTLFGG